MSDTFASLRSRLPDYLREKSIDPRRRFRCLNPAHLDRDPSMGYDARREKVHCFSCGADYDLFDLLALDLSLSSPLEALAEASRRYGSGTVTFLPPGARSSVPSSPAPPQTHFNGPLAHAAPSEGKDSPPPPASAPTHLSARGTPLSPPSPAYIPACASHRGETDYFFRRGLPETLCERFSLGYDPALSCVVLPCDDGRVVRRSTTGKRYLNERGVPSPLFQSALLRGTEPVFLVEGVFDALSAEALGHRAVALNGSGNRAKAEALLRADPAHAPVLVLPDADRAGESWARELIAACPELFLCPPLPQGKDLNELLCADPGACADFLAHCLASFPRPEPYANTSAAGQLAALEAYIASQAARAPRATGFPKLDDALDGGLYDGLYVLGAVSSLGKTAFCMQLADQLAQQGRDVLIFSLEMTAYELMARSVSRETFLIDPSRARTMGKSVRGVLDGRRYADYTPAELAHLAAAKERYAAYAPHLYFHEGDRDLGTDDIARAVARHIRETGERPVVLVDYLQILAPADVHFTDKQNLDRAVCALKRLAREESVTVLAISSFNRENYNLEVSMSAFKESGGIDYSADVLIGLQARGVGRPNFRLEEEKRRDPRELELRVLKNRSAAVPPPLFFRYYPAYSCFEET